MPPSGDGSVQEQKPAIADGYVWPFLGIIGFVPYSLKHENGGMDQKGWMKGEWQMTENAS